MVTPSPRSLPESRAGFLLSHHLPERYDRTLRIPTRRGEIRLCARCAGQLLGGVAYLAVLLSGVFAIGVWLAPQVQLLFLFAPLPAAIDWGRQAVRGSESTNARRVISGALLGVAFLDVAFLAAERLWLGVLVAVIAFLAYTSSITASLWVSGAWRRVVEEHLPGIDLSGT